jgi:hypothetical protein
MAQLLQISRLHAKKIRKANLQVSSFKSFILSSKYTISFFDNSFQWESLKQSLVS